MEELSLVLLRGLWDWDSKVMAFESLLWKLYQHKGNMPHRWKIPFHFGCCKEKRVAGTVAHSGRFLREVQNIVLTVEDSQPLARTVNG